MKYRLHVFFSGNNQSQIVYSFVIGMSVYLIMYFNGMREYLTLLVYYADHSLKK